MDDLRDIDPALIKLIKDAVGETDFKVWMEKSIPTLEGRTPLEVIRSPGGVEQIKSLLIMINYGVPS